ncbi:MAG TPA: hypothetical protein VGO89_04335, partial [Streptomyces sp.]|nr:hypothetical protein [Streptomyces sp.]
IILDEDGSRHQVNGWTLPAVTLTEASIFGDPTKLWADVYEVPPRETTPWPLPPGFAAVAERDQRDGIARFPSCRCGAGCGCPGCGRQIINVARGLDWGQQLSTGEPHGLALGCRGPNCVRAEPGECPECCAMPMMLAPVGWVCRRDSEHRRPYQW